MMEWLVRKVPGGLPPQSHSKLLPKGRSTYRQRLIAAHLGASTQAQVHIGRSPAILVPSQPQTRGSPWRPS
jgi:hypothetical protein